MTPKEAAIDLIKVYVERGDSISSLKAGQQGVYGSDYHASIGGWINGKRLTTDYILVEKVNGEKVNAYFKLKEIYNEIKSGNINIQQKLI